MDSISLSDQYQSIITNLEWITKEVYTAYKDQFGIHSLKKNQQPILNKLSATAELMKLIHKQLTQDIVVVALAHMKLVRDILDGNQPFNQHSIDELQNLLTQTRRAIGAGIQRLDYRRTLHIAEFKRGMSSPNGMSFNDDLSVGTSHDNFRSNIYATQRPEDLMRMRRHTTRPDLEEKRRRDEMERLREEQDLEEQLEREKQRQMMLDKLERDRQQKEREDRERQRIMQDARDREDRERQRFIQEARDREARERDERERQRIMQDARDREDMERQKNVQEAREREMKLMEDRRERDERDREREQKMQMRQSIRLKELKEQEDKDLRDLERARAIQEQRKAKEQADKEQKRASKETY